MAKSPQAVKSESEHSSSETEEKKLGSTSGSEADSESEEAQTKKNKEKFTEVAKSAATSAQAQEPAISAKAQTELDAKTAQVEKETETAAQDGIQEAARKSRHLTPAEIEIDKKFTAAKGKFTPAKLAELEKSRLEAERDVTGRKQAGKKIVEEAQKVDEVVLPAIEAKATEENTKRDTAVAAQEQEAEKNAQLQEIKRKAKLDTAQLKREADFNAAKSKPRKLTPAKQEQLRLEREKGKDARIEAEVLGQQASAVGATKEQAIAAKAQTELDAQTARNEKEEQAAEAHKAAEQARQQEKQKAAQEKADKQKKSKSFVPTAQPTVLVKPTVAAAATKETVGGTSKVAELASKFAQGEQAEETTKKTDVADVVLAGKVKELTQNFQQQRKASPPATEKPAPTSTIAEQVKVTKRASPGK